MVRRVVWGQLAIDEKFQILRYMKFWMRKYLFSGFGIPEEIQTN